MPFNQQFHGKYILNLLSILIHPVKVSYVLMAFAILFKILSMQCVMPLHYVYDSVQTRLRCQTKNQVLSTKWANILNEQAGGNRSTFLFELYSSHDTFAI